MADIVTIRLELLGAREVVVEARSASGAITTIGTATSRAGVASATAAPKFKMLRSALAAVWKWAKYAAVAIGGVVTVALYKSVTAATDLGEQLNKNKEVFEESASGVIGWSKKTARAFGISQRAALEYAGTFGNLLIPMGFARDEAAKVSKSLVELAADMASFNNTTPEEALEALRSGLIGEAEPLRRYGVQLSDARLQQEMAREGISGTTTELSEQQKAMLRLGLIMQDTKDAQGDFGRTSGSLANQQRILGANLEDLAAKIGKKLLPVVTDVVKWLNRFVTQMMRGKGQGGKFVDTLVDVWEAVKDVVGALRDAVTWVGNAGREINENLHPIEAFNESWKTLKNSMEKVKPGFQAIHGVLKATWDVFSGIAGAMGDVIGKIGELLDAFSHLPGPLRSLLGLDESTYVVPLNPDHTSYGGGPDANDRGPGAGKNPQFAKRSTRRLSLGAGGGGPGVVHAHFHVDGQEMAEVMAGIGENAWART